MGLLRKTNKNGKKVVRPIFKIAALGATGYYLPNALGFLGGKFSTWGNGISNTYNPLKSILTKSGTALTGASANKYVTAVKTFVDGKALPFIKNIVPTVTNFLTSKVIPFFTKLSPILSKLALPLAALGVFVLLRKIFKKKNSNKVASAPAYNVAASGKSYSVQQDNRARVGVPALSKKDQKTQKQAQKVA